MKHALKLLLAWCLLFAIPFQGIATAGMLVCDPAPVQVQATADGGTAPCHDMAPAAAEGHAGCDACSACSLGTAMAPPAVSPSMLPQQHPPASSSLLVHLPAGTPDTLERPPRTRRL